MTETATKLSAPTTTTTTTTTTKYAIIGVRNPICKARAQGGAGERSPNAAMLLTLLQEEEEIIQAKTVFARARRPIIQGVATQKYSQRCRAMIMMIYLFRINVINRYYLCAEKGRTIVCI